jgi:choline dehydrogenase-like flavoprotein
LPRGKGLGGSSGTNFSCWILGHRDDYNQWANLVGDDCWKWDGKGGVQQRFRKIENYHIDLDEAKAKIVDREAQEKHSKGGMLDLSWGGKWHEVEFLTHRAAIELGVSFQCPLQFDADFSETFEW